MFGIARRNGWLGAAVGVALMGTDASVKAQEKAPADKGRTDAASSETARETNWRAYVGVVARQGPAVSFRTGWRSAGENIPAQATALAPGYESRIGAAGQYANRQYDDGFVGMDPGVAGDGNTWNWGYQHANQVADGFIVFTLADAGKGTDFVRTQDATAGDWDAKGGMKAGAVVGVRRTLGREGSWNFDLDLSVSYVPFGRIGGTASTMQDRQEWQTYSVSVADRFDLAGIRAPSAPYDGRYDGPGALLYNKPTERTVTRSGVVNHEYDARNSIAGQVDADLVAVSMGASAAAQRGRWRLTAEAGPALNILMIKATQAETLSASSETGETTELGRWSDSASDTVLRLGVFGGFGVGRDVSENCSLRLAGRYDWAGAIKGEVGPSGYSIDLSGFSGSLEFDMTW